jgi:hypothetical protein
VSELVRLGGTASEVDVLDEQICADYDIAAGEGLEDRSIVSDSTQKP